MLNEKEQKILQAYEKQLEKPKWQFILRNGLIWGLLVFIIMFLEQYLVKGRDFSAQWKNGLAIDLIILPFAGLLYGWFIRMLINRKYQQLKQKETAN